MNTSSWKPDDTYTLPDRRVVFVPIVFVIIQKYLLSLAHDMCLFLHDEQGRAHRVLSVSCLLDTVESTRSDGEFTTHPTGRVSVEFTVDIDTAEKKFTIPDFYKEHCDMFDNLVRRICVQSPELIDRVLLKS